jgi:hypothetical protein
VFTSRYGLNIYIQFKLILVFKGLRLASVYAELCSSFLIFCCLFKFLSDCLNITRSVLAVCIGFSLNSFYV